jgi:hypothetical protein
MLYRFHVIALAAAVLVVVIDSYKFFGSVVGRPFSSAAISRATRPTDIVTQMVQPSAVYSSSTPSDLFSHIMSDEEEEEEPEAPPTTTDAPGETSEMSSVKEGIMFPTTLNGTDVRVGIIMARWNSDIIAGLYKVIHCFCITNSDVNDDNQKIMFHVAAMIR